MGRVVYRAWWETGEGSLTQPAEGGRTRNPERVIPR